MNSQCLLSRHHLRFRQLSLIVLVVKRSSAILDEHLEVKIGFDSKHRWLKLVGVVLPAGCLEFVRILWIVLVNIHTFSLTESSHFLEILLFV